MNIKRLTFLVVLLLVTISGCRKHFETPVEEKKERYYWSVTKANINGNLWGDCEVSVFTGNKRQKSKAEDYQGKSFSISALNFCSSHEGINTTVIDVYIFVDQPLVEGGVYQLKTENFAGISGWVGDWNHFIAKTDENHLGELFISNLKNDKISGLFSFSVFDDSLNIDFVIENGKFEDMSILNR